MNKEANRVNDDDIDDDNDDDIDDAEDGAYIETIVMTEMPVNDSGADTAELQVDELIAQVEAQSEEEILRRRKVRQRFEELSEKMNLDDTYAFEFEDGD